MPQHVLTLAAECDMPLVQKMNPIGEVLDCGHVVFNEGRNGQPLLFDLLPNQPNDLLDHRVVNAGSWLVQQ